MHHPLIKQIISGGQTGVDRAALDVAIELKIPHGGYCPFGRLAEDGVIPETYHLIEAPAPNSDENHDADSIYKKRTELNVIHSDGTLIITKDNPIGGTLYTIKMVQQHQKPYLIFYLGNSTELITNWLQENNIQKLNVAGPRASQCEAIYNSTYQLLKQILTSRLG